MADFLKSGVTENDDDLRAVEIEVLAENWNIVQVFRRASPQWITGLHAPRYAGIAAVEIETAARMLGVAADEDLFNGVLLMAGVAARAYSQKK